jgi:hypothetical protein
MQGRDKIIHIPKDGEFLKARLKPDPEKKSWETVQLRGWAIAESRVYFLDGKQCSNSRYNLNILNLNNKNKIGFLNILA